ncbi:zinc finger, CCHC-type containing protein [Tanacetum coccineum]
MVRNKEQKLLKDVYYVPTLKSNVISLEQVTISGYDISIRGDFLTMRDSLGSLLIKVPRSANHLYKAQLKVVKEYTNEVGRESGTFPVLCNDIQENLTNQVVDTEANPHNNPLHNVTVHATVTRQNSPEDTVYNPFQSLVHAYIPEHEDEDSGSDDTPNPIARLETIRLLMALAAGKEWKIHHLDVKNAFL